VSLPADALLEALCSHAQQAAEKAVKAVLVQGGLDVPRSHSIRALLDLLPSEVGVPDAVAVASELTGHAVEARYPGAIEAVSDEEYSRAVSLASAVVRWAAEHVSQAGAG